MKIGKIIKPNTKGQIVIPKEVRSVLKINKNTLLNLLVRENGFYVYPIKGIQSQTETDKTALLKVLKETQGMWGKAKEDEVTKEKKSRKLELKAAAKARKKW